MAEEKKTPEERRAERWAALQREVKQFGPVLGGLDRARRPPSSLMVAAVADVNGRIMRAARENLRAVSR